MRCTNCGYESRELSKRELEVEELIVQGLMHKEIAYALGISEHTEGAHRVSIYRKRGVRNAVELSKLFFERKAANS